MPIYAYQAYDHQGGKYQSEIEATDKDSAIKELLASGILVSSINEKIQIDSLSLLTNSKVSLQELEFLTSELSLLLKNGVKIDKGLAIISQYNSSGAIGKLISNLLTAIRRGQPLSEAMEAEGNTFNSLYINLVKLGEASGNLPIVFERLSRDLKFQRELKDKLIQALTYPLIIFTVCILCILFVFNYIVPQMSGLFSGISDLPDYTLALLNVSEWFQNYQWLLLLGIIVLGFSIGFLRKNPIWRTRFNDWAMRIPGVKTIMLLAEQIRFNSALSMMSEAGLALDKAMMLASASIKNRQLSQDMLAAQQKIRKGAKLSDALAMSSLFPSFSISLLEVGEESGELASVFEELSSRAKTQFDNAINKFTTVLEPLLILVMGGIVGSVVVTMLLSIVSVNDIGI